MAKAFVHALELKLALEVQKLGYRTLDDVIAVACRIEWLQKDYPSNNMGSLASVLQNELRVVCKDLKESAGAMAKKVVSMAQPSAASPEVATSENQYVALPSEMSTP